MTCGDPNGAACNSDLPTIPATMISYADGLALRNLSNPLVSFLAAPAPALHFAVDENARLREIGWLVWPAWECESLLCRLCCVFVTLCILYGLMGNLTRIVCVQYVCIF